MHRIHNNFWREPKEFAIPPTLCSRAQKKKNRFKKNDSHGKMIGSCACQLSSEVTPYHSGSLSHHWGHRRVLLALLPAWAGAPIIIHQDITAYAMLPLWSAHLVRASHQRGQKDMMRAHTLHWPASTWMTGGRNSSQLIYPCNAQIIRRSGHAQLANASTCLVSIDAVHRAAVTFAS